VGCGSSSKGGFDSDDGGGGGQSGGANDDGGLSFGSDATLGGSDGSTPAETVDPQTCAEAAQTRSYVGCDYWPTAVANVVWSIFDFAVVVANAGSAPASVTVTGPNGTSQTATVAPGSLTKIYLPWVPDLKGPDDNCEVPPPPLATSVLSRKGAYHLVSSVPVTVYQFNAIEYGPSGGPPGKDWNKCPTKAHIGWCTEQTDCLSYTNDASLLLPSTAMTGNYRVAGIHGWSESGIGPLMGPYFAVTATADGTHVKVKVANGGAVLAGGTIPATGAGGLFDLTLDAGDVAEIVAPQGDSYDLSGSQVAADKPVQVIAGIPCINVPEGAGTCDHVEESVLPAETLGRHYVVTVPTAPHGKPLGHLLRIYGNVDNTHLTGLPSGCPGGAIVNAGQVIDCGTVSGDFEVTGDHEFSMSSFMQGATIVDPGQSVMGEGDPSQSQMVAVEQYRTKYVFLAPDDYDTSFVDVVAPSGSTLTLDGPPLSTPLTPVGTGGFGVARVKLGAGKEGAHVMTGSKPFGIQIIGYGRQTSYQYPGGLDLRAIAPPPPPPK